jgi:hypothetical protein
LDFSKLAWSLVVGLCVDV